MRITVNDVKQLCQEHGMVYLGGFIDTNKPFEAICSCGTTVDIKYQKVKLKSLNSNCSKSSHEARYLAHQVVLPQDEIRLELEQFGFELLRPYEGCRVPIAYICSCGGIGCSTIGSIRLGTKCGKCHENNYRQIFLDHGCEIITYTSAALITYLCHCGNVYTTAIGRWLKDNHCLACKTRLNSNPLPSDRRPNLNSWKKKVLEKDGFKCINCEHTKSLEVHHIEGYSARPDLRTAITNGVTLCDVCHTSLHQLYGHNVGLKNLMEALQNDTH